ncbi:hypothetical protein Taro_025079 [Colocasia esculenta]|uniref:Uncharacterized protein n=1 Tax=Colocasia esculenta TaxID=4460 RepID=A0A843VGG4_COLES|nr:hypothetical protein [Colocasia esculenta]
MARARRRRRSNGDAKWEPSRLATEPRGSPAGHVTRSPPDPHSSPSRPPTANGSQSWRLRTCLPCVPPHPATRSTIENAPRKHCGLKPHALLVLALRPARAIRIGQRRGRTESPIPAGPRQLLRPRGTAQQHAPSSGTWKRIPPRDLSPDPRGFSPFSKGDPGGEEPAAAGGVNGDRERRGGVSVSLLWYSFYPFVDVNSVPYFVIPPASLLPTLRRIEVGMLPELRRTEHLST